MWFQTSTYTIDQLAKHTFAPREGEFGEPMEEQDQRAVPRRRVSGFKDMEG